MQELGFREKQPNANTKMCCRGSVTLDLRPRLSRKIGFSTSRTSTPGLEAGTSSHVDAPQLRTHLTRTHLVHYVDAPRTTRCGRTTTSLEDAPRSQRGRTTLNAPQGQLLHKVRMDVITAQSQGKTPLTHSRTTTYNNG